MKETIDTIIKWHTETFPDATFDGQVAKFEEEESEFRNASEDEDILEIADMVIVSCGIARFDYPKGLWYLNWAVDVSRRIDYGIYEIWEAVENKMQKNRKRIWNKTGNGTYHHENGIED